MSEILLLVILIILSLLIISLYIILIYVGKSLNKSIEKKNKLEEKKFLFSIDITNGEDDSYLNLLDNLVQESLMRYRVAYIEYQVDIYINEKTQKDMIDWILRDTISRISPVYYEKITFIYNKDRLEDIIYDKVSLAVLNYSLSVNGDLNNKK